MDSHMIIIYGPPENEQTLNIFELAIPLNISEPLSTRGAVIVEN